jgi:hypothetical protein
MRRVILGFVAAWGLSLSCFGATLTVDLIGGADYTEIQPAIDAAADGDTVLVKPGEYVVAEPIDFNKLHDPEDPASPPVKNIVVRSDGGAEATTIRMSVTPADPNRASLAVFESGESKESKLEGFVLTGGKGTGDENYHMGGAISCKGGSSPEIIKCHLRGNRAWGGGGINCLDSSPTLIECVVTANTASGAGGIFCGGNASVTAQGCTISSNQVTLEGGGVLCNRGATIGLAECTVSANSANWGGGIYVSGATVKLERSLVEKNTALASGAGILSDEGGTLLLTNSVVAYNSSENAAGGLSVGADSTAELLHTTVAYNQAASFGPGIYLHQGEMTVTSSIIWHHAGPSILVDGGAPPQVSYSCIQGGSTGTGNISEDPQFAGSSDFHLLPDSPAIDTARAEGSPAIDIEGKPRPCGLGYDMGAYELECAVATPFRRGDANADGETDIGDAMAILGFLYRGEPPELSCRKAGDVNDSGAVDISDPVYLLGYVFLGGPAPKSPFPECGVDPFIDDLTCESFPVCQ